MKILLPKLLITLACCLLMTPAWADELPRAEPEEVGLSSDRLDRFSAVMEQGVEAEHFPGAVAAVARNGKIAFFESYGFRDREAGLPMEDDSIFRIASMTKAITGVAVMILFEEGRFGLNEPISNYIPAFKNSRVLAATQAQNGKSGGKNGAIDESCRIEGTERFDEACLRVKWDSLSDEVKEEVMAAYASKGGGKDKSSKGSEKTEVAETVAANRPITIRDLLRHTAGISYQMGDIYSEGDDLGQMIDKLAGQPLVSQPGTQFDYGLSMDVLARLVEVVSGQSYDDFLQERIFTPLDMTDTAFWVPEDQATRLIKMPEGKAVGKGGKEEPAEDVYLAPPAILGGGSGLVSTTRDYIRFVMMLLNEGELDGHRILGRKSVELMRANQMKDVVGTGKASKNSGEWRFGLTFGIKTSPGDRGELGSEGIYYWGGAYGTTFWIDPRENLVGVFMVNGLAEDLGKTQPYSQMLEHFTYQAIID